MYLIELKPGQEAIYASPAAFSEAVRRGEVNSAALIYHRAKCTWLPVTVHPLFKRAIADSVRDRPFTGRSQWTFLQSERKDETPESVMASVAAAESSSAQAHTATKPGHRGWRRVIGGWLGRGRG